MTPEGKVKAKVKSIIKAYKPHVYSHWPVMNGMGEPTLDCTGCVDGQAFYVETKKDGARMTPRQARTMTDMMDGGGVVFTIVGRDEIVLAEFDAWLHGHVTHRIAKLNWLKKGKHAS
jgi:hypothetical protein